MQASSPEPPAVNVDVWPGLAITSALQLALTVGELPGIGDGLEMIKPNLSPQLADDICVLVLARIPEALTDLAVKQDTIALPPGEFLHWVDNLTDVELAESAGIMNRNAQRNRRETIQSPRSANDGDNPVDWLTESASDAQWHRLEAFQGNPAQLKTLVAYTLRDFWFDHFKALYVQHEADMVRASDRLRKDPDLQTDLAAVLTRLQGRPIQLVENWTQKHKQTLLVPLPFMGPYMMSMSISDPEELAVFAFDASRAAGLRIQSETGPDITRLKALADETRLKILRFVSESERFGGEIVTHLQISQPGVSRHLRLLKASGLLSVRQEGTSKYYSVCDAEIDALAEAVRRLKSKGEHVTKDGT